MSFKDYNYWSSNAESESESAKKMKMKMKKGEKKKKYPIDPSVRCVVTENRAIHKVRCPNIDLLGEFPKPCRFVKNISEKTLQNLINGTHEEDAISSEDEDEDEIDTDAERKSDSEDYYNSPINKSKKVYMNCKCCNKQILLKSYKRHTQSKLHEKNSYVKNMNFD